MRNCHMETKGEAMPWVIAAQAVLQFGSTIAIQAALHGIPTYMYRTEYVEGVTDTPVFELSVNHDEVESLIEDLRKGKRLNEKEINKAINIIAGDVSSLTGPFAAERIADVLAGVSISEQEEISFSVGGKVYHYLSKLIRYLNHTRKKILNPHTSIVRSEFEKIPGGIRRKDIDTKLNRLAPFIGIETDRISCKQVTTDLVSVELY